MTVDKAGSLFAEAARRLTGDDKVPLMLTPEETAELLRISRSQVWVLMKDGALGSVKIGRRRLVPGVAVEAFVATLMGQAS